jgi:hypothetical protein
MRRRSSLRWRPAAEHSINAGAADPKTIRKIMRTVLRERRWDRTGRGATSAQPRRAEQGRGQQFAAPGRVLRQEGEFRDRTFENQSFRASGLSLLTAAIVHWNTIYLDQAVQYLRAQGVVISNELLAHVAPLGWEHIGLTGNYDWNTSRPADGLRPLRAVPEAFALRAA